MTGFLRATFALIAAAAVGGLLGTALSTQFVMAELNSLGVVVPLGDRIDTTIHDLKSMGPVYSIVIGIGFIVAFAIAGLLLRVIKIPRFIAFGLAGFAAVIVAMEAMGMMYNATPIPATREIVGLMTLSAAGALGGMFYAWLTPKTT